MKTEEELKAERAKLMEQRDKVVAEMNRQAREILSPIDAQIATIDWIIGPPQPVVPVVDPNAPVPLVPSQLPGATDIGKTNVQYLPDEEAGMPPQPVPAPEPVQQLPM